MAAGLAAAVAAPAAAQSEPAIPTGAREIRELVLKHRERVLARVDALLAGAGPTSRSGRTDAAKSGGVAEVGDPDGDAGTEPTEPEVEAGEPEGGEPEDASASEESEPESDEPEDGAAEDGEPEDGAAEDEEVSELPDTGSGRGSPHGIAGTAQGMAAMLGALAALGVGARRQPR